MSQSRWLWNDNGNRCLYQLVIWQSHLSSHCTSLARLYYDASNCPRVTYSSKEPLLTNPHYGCHDALDSLLEALTVCTWIPLGVAIKITYAFLWRVAIFIIPTSSASKMSLEQQSMVRILFASHLNFHALKHSRLQSIIPYVHSPKCTMRRGKLERSNRLPNFVNSNRPQRDGIRDWPLKHVANLAERSWMWRIGRLHQLDTTRGSRSWDISATYRDGDDGISNE